MRRSCQGGGGYRGDERGSGWGSEGFCELFMCGDLGHCKQGGGGFELCLRISIV